YKINPTVALPKAHLAPNPHGVIITPDNAVECHPNPKKLDTYFRDVDDNGRTIGCNRLNNKALVINFNVNAPKKPVLELAEIPLPSGPPPPPGGGGGASGTEPPKISYCVDPDGDSDVPQWGDYVIRFDNGYFLGAGGYASKQVSICPTPYWKWRLSP